MNSYTAVLWVLRFNCRINLLLYIDNQNAYTLVLLCPLLDLIYFRYLLLNDLEIDFSGNLLSFIKV